MYSFKIVHIYFYRIQRFFKCRRLICKDAGTYNGANIFSYCKLKLNKLNIGNNFLLFALSVP